VRAARYYGREDIRLEDVPEPEPGPRDVKLRVPFSGVCGSDLQEYYAGPRRIRVDEPHPLTGDDQAFHASKVFLTASTSTLSYADAFGRVVKLMQKGLYPSESWTETIAFDGLIEESFEPLRRQEKVKVVVDMMTA
jgi:threonine dehydrogenase-like Zn-dependent dehydrogenase